MGHQVVKVELKRTYEFRPSLHLLLAIPKRMLVRLFINRNTTPVLHEYYVDRSEYLPRKHIDEFISKYLSVISVSSMDELRGGDYDAVIVGSDQVWRRAYSDQLLTSHSVSDNAFLAFTEGWQCRRIAYAASIGVDYWEYTDYETAVLRPLAHRLDAISVREDTAIGLLHEHLGSDLRIEQLLDPTLLLEREAYLKLIRESEVKPSDGQLLVYILDPSEQKSKVVDYYSDSLNLKPFDVNNPNLGRWQLPPKQRIQTPIGLWLRGFMDAQYVVADSFHACVFSIIFEKPFTVIANPVRGIARITSLLRQFSLEERMINEGDSPAIIPTAIDWAPIRSRREQLAHHAIRWLTTALSPDTLSHN
jgi:hypothetical protein